MKILRCGTTDIIVPPLRMTTFTVLLHPGKHTRSHPKTGEQS